MPLLGTFGKTVGRMWKRIEEAGASPDTKDFIMLAAEASPWKGELYINVLKEIPNAENVRLSGTYIARVLNQYANQKGKSVRKYYFYYTTCPKCAKIYGHNYVVAFAEV